MPSFLKVLISTFGEHDGGVYLAALKLGKLSQGFFLQPDPWQRSWTGQ